MAMNKQRKSSNLLNILNYDDAGNIVLRDYSQTIRYNWNGTIHAFTGPLSISSIAAAVTDTDRFLVSDGGVLKYRTGAEVLSDIGGVPSTRTLTINGTAFDLSADRSWTIAAGITGSGVANQLTYWNGTGSVTGSANLVWDNTNARLGIGTSSPATRLDIVSASGAVASGVAIRNNGSGSSDYASLNLYNNTANIGQLFFTGSGYFISGLIGPNGLGFYNNGAGGITLWADSGAIKFQTGTGGGTLNSQRMTLTAAGRLLLGTTTESVYILDAVGLARFSADILVANNFSVGVGVGSGTAFNTILGIQAHQLTTSGGWSTAIGYQALRGNINGNFNTAVGSSALTSGGGGSHNTSLGFYALGASTSGSNNLALGSQSGSKISGGVTDLTTSNNSIFIGYNAFALGNSQTNQIVIGTSATGLGSNTTVIGNSSTTDTAIYGRMLVNYSSPVIGTFALDVNGTARVSTNLTIGGSNNTRNTLLYFDGGTTSSRIGQGYNNGMVFFSSFSLPFKFGFDQDATNFTTASYTLGIGGFNSTLPMSFSIGGSGIGNRVLTFDGGSTSQRSGIGSGSVSQGGLALYTFSGFDMFFGSGFDGSNINSSNAIMWISASNSSLNIGSTSNLASSILTLASTTKGFRPPVMTTAQKNAISTPAAGLQVYDNTDNYLSLYNGTNWQNIVSPNSAGNILVNSVTDLGDGAKLQVNGGARINHLYTHTTGVYTSGLFSFTSVTTPTSPSYTSGMSYGAGESYYRNEFQGSATIPNSVIQSAQFNASQIRFVNSSTAITMTQGGSGIRAYASEILQFSFDNAQTACSVSHVAGMQILAPYYQGANNPTITNLYGIVLNDSAEYSATLSVTNRWAIYQDGASDNNYFKGKVVIGSTNTVGVSRLNVKDLPTSASGLATGDVWNNGGVLNIV